MPAASIVERLRSNGQHTGMRAGLSPVVASFNLLEPAFFSSMVRKIYLDLLAQLTHLRAYVQVPIGQTGAS